MENKEIDMLNLLLRNDIPKPETKELEIKRLTEVYGTPFIVTIREVPYNRFMSFLEFEGADAELSLVVDGILKPSLKDIELLESKGAATSNDLACMIYKTGEIKRIAREIEKLSGFDKLSVAEIKKK